MELSSQEGRKFHSYIRKTVGYCPRSLELYRRALTHRSAIVHGDDGRIHSAKNNERLEFLGDAIIEMIVSLTLHEKFEGFDEGVLTQVRSNLVCRTRLNEVAFEIGLDEHITLQSRQDIYKSHIPGDAVEALVAAIYLDGGMRRAERFVRKNIANERQIERASVATDSTNYKSELLMRFDGRHEEITFDTHKLNVSTKDDDGNTLNFISKVARDGIIIGVGYGTTKKNAEQKAARSALTQLEASPASENEAEENDAQG